MSLFDLLAKTGDKVKGLGNNLYNRIRNAEVQPITLNQLSEDGGVDVDATMRVLDKTTPLTLGERFTGRTLTKDFQKYNPETKQFEMTTATINRPGLLQDISQGYEENRFTPASIANLQQNTLDNGREKGFAYRLGEGLGSLAKFASSPLGRGLIVGGIVGANGGSGLEALTYGAGTTTANQGNVLRDRVYRNDLINSRKASLMNNPNWNTLSPEEENEIMTRVTSMAGYSQMPPEQQKELLSAARTNYLNNRQQEQIRAVENEINGYRGFIDNSIYDNMIKAQQLRDNAEYRNLLLQTQMQNQADLLKLKQQEAERQAKQDAFDNYYKGQNIAQGWAQINAANNKPKPLSDSQVKDLKGTTEFINSLDNIIGRYSDVKYDSLFGIKGDIRRNNPLSRYDAGASLFKQDVEILRQRYAKLLEGGRLSDSDRAFYQKALFNPNTSRKDFIEAARRMKATLQQDYKNSLSMYAKQGKDISEFYVPDTQQNNQNADPLGIL